MVPRMARFTELKGFIDTLFKYSANFVPTILVLQCLLQTTRAFILTHSVRCQLLTGTVECQLPNYSHLNTSKRTSQTQMCFEDWHAAVGPSCLGYSPLFTLQLPM